MNLKTLSIPAVLHRSKNGASKYWMLVLHGRGDSPRGFEWLPDTLQIPSMNYLMLQAPDDFDSGGIIEGYSWYPPAPNQLKGVIRSRNLLEKFMTEIRRQGVDLEQVFLFGFSQGCLMTLEFGARYPQKLAGYIGISGYCLDEKLLAKESSPVARNGSWLVTHGRQDDILPFSKTEQQIHYLQTQGFNLTFSAFDKTHTIDEVLEIPLLRNWIKERMR